MNGAREKRAVCFTLLAVFLFTLCPSYAAAKEKPLGAFGAWHAFVSTEGGQTVCYMVTTKRVKSVPLKKRGAPYIMITHRPIEASTDVVSYGAGTIMDSRKPVRLATGKNTFDLFSVRDTAWARDSRTDHKIVAALKNSLMLKLTAYPAKRSAPLVDIFDITQASAAYRAIGKACGLPNETPQKPPQHQKNLVKPATNKK